MSGQIENNKTIGSTGSKMKDKTDQKILKLILLQKEGGNMIEVSIN